MALYGMVHHPVTLFFKVINTEVMTDIPTWFCDSKLNYAENLLKFNDNRTAIITSGIVLLTHYINSQLNWSSITTGRKTRNHLMEKTRSVW
jgi:hypothetical protein